MSPDYEPEDINTDDRFNLIAPGKRYHPSMRRRRDPTVDPRTIIPTRRVMKEQERLRAEANQIEVLSKTEARIAGVVVTLDPTNGRLFCSCPSCAPDCRHVTAVRAHAVKHRPR